MNFAKLKDVLGHQALDGTFGHIMIWCNTPKHRKGEITIYDSRRGTNNVHGKHFTDPSNPTRMMISYS